MLKIIELLAYSHPAITDIGEWCLICIKTVYLKQIRLLIIWSTLELRAKSAFPCAVPNMHTAISYIFNILLAIAIFLDIIAGLLMTQEKDEAKAESVRPRPKHVRPRPQCLMNHATYIIIIIIIYQCLLEIIGYSAVVSFILFTGLCWLECCCGLEV